MGVEGWVIWLPSCQQHKRARAAWVDGWLRANRATVLTERVGRRRAVLLECYDVM